MSAKFGPTMLLGAAKLLTEQKLPVFTDVDSARHAIVQEATYFIEHQRCSIGILQLAKSLQNSTRDRIIAVLMKQEQRSTLGEIPAVIDTETQCSRDDFCRFLAAQF